MEITADESETGDAARTREAFLTLAFQAERPLDPPLRFPLSGVESAVISRGPVVGASGERLLAIELPDRFISGPHLSLHRAHGRYVLQDEESRNGTFVDGVEIDRCELRDGAVIEVGRSFLIYREQEGPADALDSPPLSTLLPAYAAQLRALERVAATQLPVVLHGESGTGKEVLARAVHDRSGRKGPYQPINCAALPASLAESELFGHRKGAFSGATEDRPGLVRSATGGTLFLDEIGDLALPLQALLLRVLQESEVLPIGATRPVPVDLRLVAATHRNLDEMVAAGTFRADLLARITGFTLTVPPLRERKEDLGALAATLLRRHAGAGAAGLRFSLAAARALFRHRWPLNVRELEKALAVAAALAPAGRIELDQLPPAVAASLADAQEPPPKALADEPEKRREELVALLREHQGNVSAVARALGKARMQVHRWMRRYGIEPGEFRS